MNLNLIGLSLWAALAMPGLCFAGNYIDHGDSTVTDVSTHLTWVQTETSQMTWEAALVYCEGLSRAGKTDWRLPNVKELASLVDDSTTSPSINTIYFPGTSSSSYWTSTTLVNGSSFAWCVYFYGGNVSSYNGKAFNFYVRCVR